MCSGKTVGNSAAMIHEWLMAKTPATKCDVVSIVAQDICAVYLWTLLGRPVMIIGTSHYLVFP